MIWAYFGCSGPGFGLFWGLWAWIWVILVQFRVFWAWIWLILGVMGLDLGYFGGYGPGFGIFLGSRPGFGPIIKPTGLIGFSGIHGK